MKHKSQAFFDLKKIKLKGWNFECLILQFLRFNNNNNNKIINFVQVAQIIIDKALLQEIKSPILVNMMDIYCSNITKINLINT